MRPTHLNTQYRHELSPRQREVMALLTRGLTNSEIAESLGVSLDGAKYHVREILGKLGAESREEAVEIWLVMPTRPKASVRFGGALAWKIGGGIVVMAITAALAAVVVFQLSGDANDSAQPSTTPIPIATIEPTPTTKPALADCTSADVVFALETVNQRDDVLVRLSASGAIPCRLFGTLEVGLNRAPVDPGPAYPPEANIARRLEVTLEFPFSEVLGEWKWENWCAEPMSWVFWQAKQMSPDGPQVGLSNDFFPPCRRPG